MRIKRSIHTETALQTIFGEMRQAFRASGFLNITASDKRPRSLDQNAISFIWYEQIAREIGEYTPEGVRCECKLRYGVPIMRAEDEDFRAFYDLVIKPLTYEQKLRAMVYTPVTSLMNTDQLNRYLDDMQRAYIGRCDLRFPEER